MVFSDSDFERLARPSGGGHLDVGGWGRLDLGPVRAPDVFFTLRCSTPDRGIWCYPEHDLASIGRATLRPEFQLACIDMADMYQEGRFAGALQPLVDAQIPLRQVRFETVIGRNSYPGRRDIQKIARGLSFDSADAAALANVVGTLAARFAQISGAQAWRVEISSERGLRRMELEQGSCPSNFHIDDSHLRLIAAIVGPPTVCAVDCAGVSLRRGIAAQRGIPASSTALAPFCFEEAVRRNLEMFLAPVIESSGAIVGVPPRGSAVVFGGSRRATGQPLVHAGPQPTTTAEALGWRRLLVVIDELHP